MTRQAAFAAILYGILIVVTAPATILAWALARASNGALAIEQPQGGLWHGHAEAVVYTDKAGHLHRHLRVSWEFRWSQLWQDELCADIRLDDRNLRGSARIAIGPQGLRFDKVDLASPASVFAEYFPGFVSSPLLGDLSLRSEDVRLRGGNVFGEATLTWRHAGSALADANVWGDYAARINGSGGPIEFRLETLGGSLYVDGMGTWSSNEGISFDGSAHALPGAQAAIADTLKVLGPGIGRGVHRIRLQNALDT
jgi:hypothetical protein